MGGAAFASCGKNSPVVDTAMAAVLDATDSKSNLLEFVRAFSFTKGRDDDRWVWNAHVLVACGNITRINSAKLDFCPILIISAIL